MHRIALCFLALALPCANADDFKLEEGFTLLFNGKDLSGWKTDKDESLDGRTEAYAGRFKVSDGILTIDDKVKGDKKIFTMKEFDKDVHIKFDFLPGAKCNNDLFLRGLKFDLKVEDVKKWKEGEWNTFEIVLKGDRAEFKCNGESLKTMPVKGKGTNVAIRAELGPMKVKNLRAKEG
jgi:hypothetical protein